MQGCCLQIPAIPVLYSCLGSAIHRSFCFQSLAVEAVTPHLPYLGSYCVSWFPSFTFIPIQTIIRKVSTHVWSMENFSSNSWSPAKLQWKIKRGGPWWELPGATCLARFCLSPKPDMPQRAWGLGEKIKQSGDVRGCSFRLMILPWIPQAVTFWINK